MTPEQISRFPRLAELKSCLASFDNHANLDTQISHTKELLALLPDVDDMLIQEINTLEECAGKVEQSFKNMLQLKSNIEQEYADILSHVSTETWYREHLVPALHQRDKWLCNITQLQHLLLVWSKMDQPWKYPVTIVNAQHADVINKLLSCYLLYLVDVDHDLLLKQYNSMENSVQPRVKLHSLPNFNWDDLNWQTRTGYNAHDVSWGVPQEQMCLVVVWNLFERFNLWNAEKFLEKLKPLLRPGGQIFFNMFNAESANAAAFVANGKIGALTRQQIEQLAEKLELQVELWIPTGSDMVSVSLRTSGTLSSDKTHWPLGIIKKS